MINVVQEMMYDYPIVTLVLSMYIFFTLVVNALDENEKMWIRYLSVGLIPWVYAFYFKWSILIQYGV